MNWIFTHLLSPYMECVETYKVYGDQPPIRVVQPYKGSKACQDWQTTLNFFMNTNTFTKHFLPVCEETYCGLELHNIYILGVPDKASYSSGFGSFLIYYKSNKD